MGLCAYTVKKEQGRQRYDWDPQTPETIGQSVVLAVLFFICWDCSGNDFLQSHEHGDEEYAGTMVCGDLCACGAVVSGLLQPVRRHSEEALCVDPGGILICQTSLSGIICYASAVCVSFQASVIVCALTMHSGFSGILLFFGLVFPQGIFYALAAYLLWIVVREPVRGNEQSRILSMILLTALGIAAETLINPEVSAGVFRFFS